MLEVVWDTTGFNDKNEWPTDGSQPFVLSTGDPTGLGQHADYVFGWKGDSLQKAMDTGGCMGASCAGLKTQSITDAKKCAVKQVVQENHDGCKFSLIKFSAFKKQPLRYYRDQGTSRCGHANDVKRWQTRENPKSREWSWNSLNR
jgi:hypothetical protein